LLGRTALAKSSQNHHRCDGQPASHLQECIRRHNRHREMVYSWRDDGRAIFSGPVLV
jgi:hypothetical protein